MAKMLAREKPSGLLSQSINVNEEMFYNSNCGYLTQIFSFIFFSIFDILTN
jgi:hypothetical protein